MSLVKYLEENEIDRIEDDQEFMEAEHDAIQTYCENCGYCIVDEDLSIIKSRGFMGGIWGCPNESRNRGN